MRVIASIVLAFILGTVGVVFAVSSSAGTSDPNGPVLTIGGPKFAGGFSTVEDTPVTIHVRATPRVAGEAVQLSSVRAPNFCQFNAPGGNSGNYLCKPGIADDGTYVLTVLGDENGLPVRHSFVLEVKDRVGEQLVLAIAMAGDVHAVSDPLPMQVTLTNTGTRNVIVSKGLKDEQLHLDLVFRDSRGLQVRARELTGAGHAADRDGGPPIQLRLREHGPGVPRPAVPVEVLAGTASGSPFYRKAVIHNLHDFYGLPAGRWSVQAVVRLGTSPTPAFTKTENAEYAEAPLNPVELKSQVIHFELTP